jgi:hypothetical protein
MIPEKLPRTATDLLAHAPRAVAHLRAQLRRKRLGLVFGSGTSKGLGFPDWKGLVRKIARHKHVAAEHLLKKFIVSPRQHKATPLEERSLASITQMLLVLIAPKQFGA